MAAAEGQQRIGGAADWPDERQWSALAAADQVDEYAPPETVAPAGGAFRLEVDLPMPAISYLELRPSAASPDRGEGGADVG